MEIERKFECGVLGCLSKGCLFFFVEVKNSSFHLLLEPGVILLFRMPEERSPGTSGQVGEAMHLGLLKTADEHATFIISCVSSRNVLCVVERVVCAFLRRNESPPSVTRSGEVALSQIMRPRFQENFSFRSQPKFREDSKPTFRPHTRCLQKTFLAPPSPLPPTKISRQDQDQDQDRATIPWGLNGSCVLVNSSTAVSATATAAAADRSKRIPRERFSFFCTEVRGQKYRPDLVLSFSFTPKDMR